MNQPMRVVLSATVIAACFSSGLLAGAARAGEARETFGAETNPTGNPIGGGKTYSRLVEKGDFRVRTAQDLIAALAKAAAGQVVYVLDQAKIDLTPHVREKKLVLKIPGGVTLASGRGRDGSAGGLIFSDELKTNPLFQIAGQGVRIAGLRIRGPDPEIREKELRRRLREGGRKGYYAFPTSDGIRCSHARLEVDNCELSGWSHAAVYLRKGAAGAHVHHNHIHHCQRLGLGYGVCLNEAAALIEGNLFDYCRHHIAGTGRCGTSYEARYNLVGPHANSHSFDMHGGRDRKDGTDVAGTWIRIHHNTFRAVHVPAVVIRGRPEKLAEIHHNWFLHARPSAAVRQTNAKGNVKSSDNRFGAGRATQPTKPTR